MTLPDLQELSRVVEVLESRWPETKIEPSLDRISHLMTLLGDPQFAYPVIHVTGTNGKTSTARMIESLLRALGLRTGLVTSPHLHQVNERIRLNGEPIPAAKFVEIYDELEPYLAIVDSESLANGGPAMSYFEALTGMAFAAFADAPVDVAVVEVGMGGTWDATNVVSPLVSVVMPIGLDHAEYLGDTVELVATEKSGIIKTGSIAVLSYQDPIPAEILLKRAVLVDAAVARQGVEFSVRDRALAIGGQALNLDGLNGSYEEILLPLFGAHQAANASVALAAVEAFFGGTVTLDIDAVREGLGSVTSPGRMEIVRRSPTVIVDAAHNPHGANSLATALEESFTFEQIIGVVSVMADKDVAGLLQALEPMFNEIVVTWNGAARAMPAAELSEIAKQVFGADRVHEEANLASAIDKAIAMADEAGMNGVGVVVTGSVVTAAAGRALMGRVGT
ncbi:MAG: folylpolyglutamate synthase/dihydrofolate synthase family protein [Actinomycetes bacterium]